MTPYKRVTSLRIQLILLFFVTMLVTSLITNFFLGLFLKIVPLLTTQQYVYGWTIVDIMTFLITFVAIFYLLTRKKIQYLESITTTVLKMADGNLNERIPVRTKDELGTLAVNINHMAQDLQTKIEQERKIEGIKNELIANVSHDLRTPVTAIMGYLRIFLDQKYGSHEQMEAYIRNAYKKAEQLETLIEHLFEYTKLTDTGISLTKQTICMNELLEQMAFEYQFIADSKNMTIQSELPSNRYFAKVDPDKFARVIDNLLSNAVKYGADHGQITIGLRPDDDGLLIRIQNSGDPIPAESLSRLFDRFYRLEKSRSQGGSGLGLPISKSIVNLHCGRIWAESAGGFNQFFVWIPFENQENSSAYSIVRS